MNTAMAIRLMFQVLKIFTNVTSIVMEIAPIAKEIKEEYDNLKEIINTFITENREPTEEEFQGLMDQSEKISKRLNALTKEIPNG